jgi:hypothetical protein
MPVARTGGFYVAIMSVLTRLPFCLMLRTCCLNFDKL